MYKLESRFQVVLVMDEPETDGNGEVEKKKKEKRYV